MPQKHTYTVADYLALFQQGDEKGFNFLFREYYSALAYFSTKITCDRPVSEELASTALERLWDRRESFDSLAAIRSFLYTTTRNLSLNWNRSRKSSNAREKKYASSQPGIEQDAFHYQIESEAYKQIIDAMSKLPDGCRRIIHMIYLQEKSPKEIAKELNITTITVSSQKIRAITLIKQTIFPALFIFPVFA